MTRILWATDLHLDHATDAVRSALAAELGRVKPTALVVTGDVSTARRLCADLTFLANSARCPVSFVLGNHDHFGMSIAGVRDAVIDLAARRPDIQWLPPAGVIQLEHDVAVVGVDGWADGRFGDAMNTPLVLNDDRLIAELAAQKSRAAKLEVKRVLADADAARLHVLLERALPAARTVFVATHIPPFVEALPRTGHLSNPDWHPILICGAVGEVLRHMASQHSEHQFVVLCGHSHVATDVMIAANLRCRVGAARRIVEL